MDELLRNLLDSLDSIGQSNEEIYDTECREMIGAAVFHMFLRPDPRYVVPNDFGLRTDAANRLARNAVVAYANAARERASDLGLDTFHARLSAFQNVDLASTVEGNYFDDFFGWMNPDHFDDAGAAIQNGG